MGDQTRLTRGYSDSKLPAAETDIISDTPTLHPHSLFQFPHSANSRPTTACLKSAGMAVEPANATKELTVADQDGKSQPSTFKLTDDSLYVKRPSGCKKPSICSSCTPELATDAPYHVAKWPEMLVPLRHVVWAEVAEGKLEVSVLAKKKGKKGSLALVHIAGSVPEAERENASAFMQAVMDAAYKGTSSFHA